MPEPVLRALDMQIGRRIDGLLPGEFRAMRMGRGIELAQIRPYEPGTDDIRDIDWNVTARMSMPHVRVDVAERVLTTWIVLDVSPSMNFGSADRRKADVAEGVVLALAHLATRRGNRVGLITHGEARPRILRPTQGRAGMLRVLTALRRDPVVDAAPVSLAATLRQARAIFRSRAAVFIVSDLMGPKDWRAALLSLSDRHEVVAVEIRDPREQQLTNVGEIWMRDPETGRELLVDTRSRQLQERFAQAARTDRQQVAALLRANRSGHVTLWTSGDWLRKFATFLSRRRRVAA